MKKPNSNSNSSMRVHGNPRRAFTVVELVIAIAVTAIVVTTVTSILSRVAKSREAARLRLDAVSRANSALESVRRDLAAVIRDGDLYYTRVLLSDSLAATPYGPMDRDEIVIYNNRLRPLQRDEYQGEGGEYESQYRVVDDAAGSALWLRRDAVPDENGEGGGLALPVVDGVVGISIEAYDGQTWYPDWDSDVFGLPWALRVTVTATGDQPGENLSDSDNTLATLRTQIPIDRIVPPPPPPEEETEDAAGDGTTPDGQDPAAGGGGTMMPPGTEGEIPGGTGGGRRPGGGRGPGGDGGRPGGGGLGGGDGTISGPGGGRPGGGLGGGGAVGRPSSGSGGRGFGTMRPGGNQMGTSRCRR